MSPVRTLLFAAVCASTALVAAPLAVAQAPAEAIGRPLPSSDLPTGTITVKVVAGSPRNPVIGTDVTLVINGKPQVARTDSAGRASFANLSPGASVQAMVRDQEAKEITSDTFAVPGDGGTRVMLTTKPWNPGAVATPDSGGGGEAPMANGGAMPDPRALSGQPRIEQTYEPGTITVIASYDDLRDTPADVPVTLVGYGSDESVKVTVKSTNSKGRAEFLDLDRTGNTVYFAMTQLVRNGAIDRGYAVPVQLDSRGGVHVVLAGEKRDSTKPPADDFTRVQTQDTPTEAGKVRVVISGAPELPATLKIYDAATRQVVAEGPATQTAVDKSRVDFQSQFAARQDIPVGMLGIVIHGGAGKDEPLSGLTVALVSADGAALATPLTGVTDDNGQAVIRFGPPTSMGALKAVVTVNGKEHVSEPFTLGDKAGGALEIIAHWEDKGRVEAIIDVPHIVGRVLYAESVNRKRTYRSAPFQTMPTAGTQLAMFFYPRTMFTFSMVGFVEDQLMGVQGKVSVTNFSWHPYSAGPDGLVIPLPNGYKGVFVGEQDQDKVATDPALGFRILRPIPPGGFTFHGGYSLPVDGDQVNWKQDLPLGTVNSSLRLVKIPGMVVKAPVQVQDAQLTNGTDIFLLEPIQIKSGQSMALTIGGLPSMPAWRTWAPRIIGLIVVATMLAGVAFALVRRKTATGVSAAREQRRNQLLDELVELDRAGGKDKRRRETLIVELEALWGDD